MFAKFELYVFIRRHHHRYEDDDDIESSDCIEVTLRVAAYDVATTATKSSPESV